MMFFMPLKRARWVRNKYRSYCCLYVNDVPLSTLSWFQKGRWRKKSWSPFHLFPKIFGSALKDGEKQERRGHWAREQDRRRRRRWKNEGRKSNGNKPRKERRERRDRSISNKINNFEDWSRKKWTQRTYSLFTLSFTWEGENRKKERSQFWTLLDTTVQGLWEQRTCSNTTISFMFYYNYYYHHRHHLSIRPLD